MTQQAQPLERVAQLAHVRAIKEESRSIDVIASTGTVDSYNERIDQTSWQLDRYLANPVVLYAHDSDELPIGTASNVGVVDGKLQATITFVTADLNPQAEQVFQLMKAKVLRAVSVGFRCHSYRWEVEQDREFLTLADCELLEISVVPVPANPEALARRMKTAGPRKSAAPHGEKRMESILKALGLSDSASEAEALEAVAKLQKDTARLIGISEAKSADEAEAEFRLWKLSHGRVAELEAAESKRKASAEAEERATLLQKAFALGRLTEQDRSDPESWVHTLSLQGLRRFAETAKQIVPAGQEHKEPAREVPASVSGLVAKGWSQLTADEKHLLHTEYPQLAAAAKAR